MSNKLINYALAKSIYSEKKNYLDTFTPFILKILSELNAPISINKLDELLKKSFDLKIPLNTIKSILSLLNNQKVIDLKSDDKHYLSSINQNGHKVASQTIENEKIIGRRLQKFWESFIEFSKKNYPQQYEANDLEKKIIDFIEKNIVNLVEHTMEIDGPELRSIDNHADDFSKQFSHFISSIEKTDNELCGIFEEMIKGSILWNEIVKKEGVIKESSFNNLTIYLDTNFLICLFGLDSETNRNSAQQLFSLIRKQNNLSVRVFSVTLEEINRLLQKYKREKENYFNIPVNDVYYFLRMNNYDDAKVDLFISKLGDLCSEYGITIESTELLDPAKFSESQKKLYDGLYRHNINLNEKKKERKRGEEAIHMSTLHDATVVTRIKNKRGVWSKNLENSKAVFLTSSSRLHSFIQKSSIKANVFPETILDLTLTNILWLKNPSSDIGCTISHIISLHTKNIFINHGIWKRFLSTIKELREENKIDDNDYASLISNNQITLNFLKTSKSDKITPQKVLHLRDQILASDIMTKEELKKAKNLITSKESELKKISKFSSTLQSKLDKTKNELDAEKRSSEKLASEISDLRNKYEQSLLDDERNRTVNSRVNDEMQEIKSDFWKLFGYIFFSLVIIVSGFVVSNDVLKLGANFTIPIMAFLTVISGIIINKASNKQYLVKFKWLFRRKKLREFLLTSIEKNTPRKIYKNDSIDVL